MTSATATQIACSDGTGSVMIETVNGSSNIKVHKVIKEKLEKPETRVLMGRKGFKEIKVLKVKREIQENLVILVMMLQCLINN